MNEADAPVAEPGGRSARWVSWALLSGLLVLAAAVVMLWLQLGRLQTQLARQTAEVNQQSVEAKAWARQAQETVQDNAARLALLEGRLSEVALQRSQLEDLMQSLSRSRDEHLVVDLEAGLRMALQQAQLTGSAEPLLAALESARQRVQRSAQPRLAPVLRALEKDQARLKAQASFELPAWMIRLDDAVALVDSLVLANQAPQAAALAAERIAVTTGPGPQVAGEGMVSAMAKPWWHWLHGVWNQMASLLRVSRIDNPEAALLSPEQSFFLRENLKLKLLNARLGLLARQYDAARQELAAAAVLVRRYADGQSRRTQQLLVMLEQAQQQLRSIEPLRLEASMPALATAAAGR
jgi:uroporphyrin-III C-methyltransferase